MPQDRLPGIPPQYQTVMPYLIIKDAAGFIAFMQAVFAAEETYKVLRDEQSGIIMHAEIMTGGSTIMLADATDQYPVRTVGLFIYVADADATYAAALAAGAQSIMPPADMPYGRSCGITDAWGNSWWPTTPPKP